LKKHDFGLTIEEYLKDRLICHINIDKYYGIECIQHLHLTNNLKSKFGEEAMAMQGHRTPGKPLFKIVRQNDEDKIPIESQSRYRYGFGMLLYIIKHSRSDLANVVRQLSTCMDGASIAAYKDMIRVIRFVSDTRDTCLKLNPNLDDEYWDWDLVV
jgi:hypothetical protein